MKVASFNIKHRIFRDNYKISNEVFNVIVSNKIDVLCLQEIPRSLSRTFDNNFKGYSINGESRYHHYLKSLPFNEKNPIISKNRVLETKTVRYRNKIKNVKEFFRYLRHIPIIPRIATIVIIKLKSDKDICIINTHLDYKMSIIQKKQLNHLLDIINLYKDKYDIVLVGDFNMDENDNHFLDFIERLNFLSIIKVSISGYTWRGKNNKKRILDYIFVSSSLRLNGYGLIESHNLSDHEIIYVDIDV